MENFLRLREIGSSSDGEGLRIAQTTRNYHDLARSQVRQIEQCQTSAINAMDIDHVGGRYLLSAGAEPAVYLYDLDSPGEKCNAVQSIPPRSLHRYGISAIHWHAFDNGLFTTSSYDNHIKAWDTAGWQEACSFDLGSKVYSHSMSPIATHSLIASACDNPAIRLCDLKSGGYSHVLRGHSGKVITTEWSPTAEHIIASGGSDGTIRLWDVRKASACIALLDQYNSQQSHGSRIPRAHSDTINGLTWSSDGLTLVSTGHDNKLRAWNMETGENLLINYGTAINNSHWQTVKPLVVDSEISEAMVFYPSDEGQILCYGLFTGYLWKRVFVLNGRVTSVVNRNGFAQVYSGDSSGQVFRWDAEHIEDVSETEAEVSKPEDILGAIAGEMATRPVTFR